MIQKLVSHHLRNVRFETTLRQIGTEGEVGYITGLLLTGSHIDSLPKVLR